jgi:hypothetical protein
VTACSPPDKRRGGVMKFKVCLPRNWLDAARRLAFGRLEHVQRSLAPIDHLGAPASGLLGLIA